MLLFSYTVSIMHDCRPGIDASSSRARQAASSSKIEMGNLLGSLLLSRMNLGRSGANTQFFFFFLAAAGEKG